MQKKTHSFHFRFVTTFTLDSPREDPPPPTPPTEAHPPDNEEAEATPSPLSSEMATPNSAPSGPKKALSELSQEELLAKCKGLLQIAQKAKHAKDGMVYSSCLTIGA